MPNVDTLDFVNDPIKNGPYTCQIPDQLRQPNIGLYALKPTCRNHIILEHENRLCDILITLESMETTKVVEGVEDRVLQELVRINQLKEAKWSGQWSRHGINGTVMNTGMFSLHAAIAADDSLEIHFFRKYPKNTTTLAIYITTLVMYILYRLPCHGMAVLLVGMRSILMSQASLLPLVSEVPKAASHTVQSQSCHPQLHLLPCLPFFISIFSWHDQKEEGIHSLQRVSQSCGKCQ